jgi:glycosyltransferase involved in cell wall biosynthesis
MNEVPIISIVVCTYNGSKKIGKTLQSLFNQNFPKHRYEVIVVDDRSTDNTLEVVSKFPVILVKHNENTGQAAARNTGLMKSRGEIVICCDDDCTADENWLNNLSRAYDNSRVMGAAGIITLPPNSSIAAEYCFHTGYGNPVPMILGRSKSVLGRFWTYLVTNLSHPQSRFKDGCLVFELPGIASSFRTEYLLEVNGWNEFFATAEEDNDICRRLKTEHPELDLVVMTSAKVVHEQQLSFWQFLAKEFKRGRLKRQYYAIQREVPPYFPFPFLFILLALIVIAVRLPVAIVPILPLFLYPWWIFRAITERNIKMVLYPYLQLLHEAATVLGLLMRIV